LSSSVEVSTGRSLNRSRAAVVTMPALYTGRRGTGWIDRTAHAAFFGAKSALIGFQSVRTAG
jgi:hypothetical protein